MEKSELFLKLFDAPFGYDDVIELLSTADERAFILTMANHGSFYIDDLSKTMGMTRDEAKTKLDQLYHRGFVNLVQSGVYVTGTLYSRLDLFAQFEPELWASVAPEKRQALDAWYLDEYGRRCLPGIAAKVQSRAMASYGLVGAPEPLLSNDVILPLDEALSFVESVTRPIYLVPCNCRSIASNCDNPIDTCLLYSHAYELNSIVFRGYGRRLTLDEAKDVIRRSDDAGLVHTVGDTAICNCDHCCCYPFRSSKRLMSHGVWPAMKYRVNWDDGRCIRCGLCSKRCHFEVFEIEKGKRTMRFDSSRCQGCGLCVSICPKEALNLELLGSRVPSLL